MKNVTDLQQDLINILVRYGRHAHTNDQQGIHLKEAYDQIIQLFTDSPIQHWGWQIVGGHRSRSKVRHLQRHLQAHGFTARLSCDDGWDEDPELREMPVWCVYIPTAEYERVCALLKGHPWIM